MISSRVLYPRSLANLFTSLHVFQSVKVGDAVSVESLETNCLAGVMWLALSPYSNGANRQSDIASPPSAAVGAGWWELQSCRSIFSPVSCRIM